MEALVETAVGKEAFTVGGPEAGQPEYKPLSVFRDATGALWSKWKPSWKERLYLLFGYSIRVGILAKQQPPISVEVWFSWPK